MPSARAAAAGVGCGGGGGTGGSCGRGVVGVTAGGGAAAAAAGARRGDRLQPRASNRPSQGGGGYGKISKVDMNTGLPIEESSDPPVPVNKKANVVAINGWYGLAPQSRRPRIHPDIRRTQSCRI